MGSFSIFGNDLKNATTKVNPDVLFSKVAQQVRRFDNPWLIFSKYIDAVNERCTELVLPKWVNKLEGATEFYVDPLLHHVRSRKSRSHIASTNPE
jgi:hypothetical protein